MRNTEKHTNTKAETNANRQQLQSLYELQRKLVPIDPRSPVERQQLVDLHLQDLHWHWKDYDTCGNLLRMLTARFHQVIQQPDFYLREEWESLSLEVMNIMHLCTVLKDVKAACDLADRYLREVYPDEYQQEVEMDRFQDR